MASNTLNVFLATLGNIFERHTLPHTHTQTHTERKAFTYVCNKYAGWTRHKKRGRGAGGGVAGLRVGRSWTHTHSVKCQFKFLQATKKDQRDMASIECEKSAKFSNIFGLRSGA